jgi:hypothetical protein
MVGGRLVQSFPIVGPSNEQIIPAFDSQSSVNWYVFLDNTTNEQALYPYAGSNKIGIFDVGANPYAGRPKGAISTETDSFFVIGNVVFRMGLDFNPIAIFTISTTTGPVKMAVGGDYLVVVDGASKWTYNIATGVPLQITDPASPTNPTSVCEQQGFFLFNTQQSQENWQSAQYNPLKFDALNTIFINYKSSVYSFPLVSQESINGRIFSFTTGFIEVLENEGKAGFTFREDQNLIFGYGAINDQSVAVGIGGIFGEQQPEFLIFVTGIRKIMMTSGGAPEVISTQSVEQKLNKLINIKDCSTFIWTENGQTFFQISWTTDKLTLAYCINSKQWFTPKYQEGRHFAESYVEFGDKKLCTSYLDNGLYELSENFASNSGEPLLRERITQNIRINGYKQYTVRLFWIYGQQGVGLVGGYDQNNSQNYVYGSTAEIEVSCSYDGGQTFEVPQTISLGTTAEWSHVTRAENLGTTRDFCMKIRCSQPLNKVAIFGSMIEMEQMGGTQ